MTQDEFTPPSSFSASRSVNFLGVQLQICNWQLVAPNVLLTLHILFQLSETKLSEAKSNDVNQLLKKNKV